jgi:hypothetical protein
VPLKLQATFATGVVVEYSSEQWIGLPDEPQPIEALVVEALSDLLPEDLQYKGLVMTGFETSWCSGGESCGVSTVGLPLVGIAIRLSSAAALANYSCEYTGQFASGVVVGPVKAGAPCRSTAANDPLVGLQITVHRPMTSDV